MKLKYSIFLLFLTITTLLSGYILSGDPAGERLENARAYSIAGYHGAAAVELKKTLNKAPDHLPSLLLLDKITTGANRNEEMLPYFSRAQKAGVKDHRIIYKLTEAYLSQHQFKNAQQHIQTLDSLEQGAIKKTDLDILKAKILVGLGDFSDAEKIYSELRKDPTTLRSAQLGLARLSVERIKFSLPYHPSYLNTRLPGGHYLFSPQARLEFSQLTEAMQNLLAAGMKSVKQVLKISPDSLEGNLIKAEIYYLQGDFPRAIEAAKYSLTIEPYNTQALFTMAKSNIGLNFYQAAKNDLIQLLALENNNLAASNTLASLFLRQGYTKDAKALLKPFIEKGVSNEDLMVNLGVLSAINNETEQALDFFKQAAETFPDSAYSRAQLGSAYSKINQHQLAINEFKQAHLNDFDNLEISLAWIENNLIVGDYSSGLRIARSLSGLHPESPSAYHILGLIYETQGKIMRAREQYDEALSIRPHYFPARIRLAKLFLSEGETRAAEELLDEGLKLDHDQLNLSIELALLEDHKNQPLNATERLINLSKKNPLAFAPKVVLGRLYLKNGYINKALEIKTNLDRLDPSSPAVIQFKGDVYTNLGNYARAAAMYKVLTEKMPGNPYHHLDLGKALLKKGALASAKTHLQKAIDVFGEQSLSSLISFTELEIQQKNFDTARNLIKKILKEKREHTEGILLYGDLLMIENKTRKAIKIYSKALDSDKKIAAIQKISLAYLQSSNKKEANIFLKKWSEELPDNPGISLAYINYYQQTGKSKQAIKEAQRFLKLQPDNSLILNKLAQLSLNSHKNKAWNYAQRAYEIAPEIPEILDTYGSLCIIRGRYAEGLDALKQAVLSAPSVPEYQYHFAKGLHQSGKSNSAKEILRLALASENPFSERGEAETLLAKLEDSFFN